MNKLFNKTFFDSKESILNKISSFFLYFVVGSLILYRLIICFSYKPEISVGETNNIWNALNVANDRAMYSNPEDTPFEIFQYTPLSQVPSVIAAKAFNKNQTEYSYRVMVAGRLFNLFFNVLTFYLVYVLLSSIFNISKTLSLTAAVTCFGLLSHIVFAVRPDSLALLFTILGVLLFSKGYFYEKKGFYVLSAFTFAFAFFAKQDAVLILPALALILVFNNQWKNAFVLSLSFIACFTIIATIFYFLFGSIFFNSILGGIALETSLKNGFAVFTRFLHYYSLLFYLVIFGLIILIKSSSYKVKIWFFTTLLFLLIFTFLTTLKLGSGVNYYTLFVIFSIIFIFYLISNVNITLQKPYTNAIVLTSLFFVLAFTFDQVYNYTAPFLKYNTGKNEYKKTVATFATFKKEAEKNNYVIFTYDKYLKLYLFKNTIFPNTEFYHVSSFSLDGYNKLDQKNKITHIIKNNDIGDWQLSTMDYYKVPVNEYKKTNVISNYTIYRNEY